MIHEAFAYGYIRLPDMSTRPIEGDETPDGFCAYVVAREHEDADGTCVEDEDFDTFPEADRQLVAWSVKYGDGMAIDYYAIPYDVEA